MILQFAELAMLSKSNEDYNHTARRPPYKYGGGSHFKEDVNLDESIQSQFCISPRGDSIIHTYINVHTYKYHIFA